jgi:branched-chain amino acid transport system ATP-binding protein
MSPPGRPKGEYRSAQHEGTPVSGSLVAVRDLGVSYGRVEALRGVSLQVAPGEVVAVLGANGAGKTTLLRTLSGLVRPRSGTAEVLGRPAATATAHQLARDGMLHIPEGRGTLQTLTVLDNLRIAYDIRPSEQGFDAALASVYARFPRLAERHAQQAGNLSGGEQQMLALARAVINRPRLLLVDEPSLGLSPLMVIEAYRTLRTFKEEGLTILLVEQNVKLALRFADRACVLRQGRIVREGRSADLLDDPEFTRHYLGSP